ncbi:MAG: hypothetical protein AB7W16_15580 [Candidatus Obscuribacterales bacterium]
MARGANITVENNFTRGLITEFSAMNFPENAVTEGDNAIFGELGRVERRPGMNYEDQFVIENLTTSDNVTYTEYEWFFVSNSGTRTFVVQQVGSNIYFFGLDDTVAISANKKSFSVDLMTFATPGSNSTDVSALPCRYATANGYLIVVHPNCDPFRVSYNLGSDSISTASIEIEIRDFKGVYENVETDARPVSLTSIHQYNLYNQGWYYGSYMNTFRSSLGVYPSNADVWWVYKDANEDFDPSLATKFTLGNTPSARGHYIYSAFLIDRTDKSGIPGLTVETAGRSRPSCIAFYAGRAFYSGVNTDGFADKVYFSQLLERDDQLGKCYQANDPTSETIFDLLDTDGGVIGLPQVKNILELRVVGDSLIVLASNGIFVIRGADNGPFRATSYIIENVSNTGAVNALSVVDTPDSLFWWNTDAIYRLGKDQIGVYFKVENISKQTIASLVSQVPDLNLSFVKGAYNKKDQVIQWVYSDEIDLTGYKYNRILNLNLAASSFYTHTIDISLGPVVSGILSVQGQTSKEFIENVFDQSGVNVTSSGGQIVTVTVEQYSANPGIFKYPTCGKIRSSNTLEGFTYSQMTNANHLDWVSYDGNGIDNPSYFISGYRIRGELLRKFNSTPIGFVLDNIEDGSLELQGIWDYGARTSTVQELYRDSSPATYVIRRVKLRGKGKSLQLKFSSTPGKPFSIVGWSTFDTGGTQP